MKRGVSVAGRFIRRACDWLRMPRVKKRSSLRSEPEMRGSHAVLVVLYVGTLIFIGLLIALLLVSYFAVGNTHVADRIVIGCIFFAYIVAGFWQLRRGAEQLAAVLLLFLYGLIASMAVFWWGISVPFGLLMFGFVIILAGITLGPRFTMPVSSLVVGILFVAHYTAERGYVVVDRARIIADPTFADVFNFGAALSMIGFVSWISGRRLQDSLRRALAAEAALEQEKQSLSSRLSDHTEKLRAAQMQEMQQLYRFAELGQLSTALIHDLANHLTVLTLDLEDIDRKRHSRAISRAKQSVLYLDKVVDQVRGQLQEDAVHRTFTIKSVIHEVIKQLSQKTRKYQVTIELTIDPAASDVKLSGDITRFRQIMTILIMNAVDAYAAVTTMPEVRSVQVEVACKRQEVHIFIRDFGEGIPEEQRHKIFKPFYSTKDDGMGIGLFIARQMVEAHFKGSVDLLEGGGDPTVFAVRLPGGVRSE